jgi:hypothetical protein
VDANVEAILGTAVTDELWLLVLRAAADTGWGSIKDAFASESNAWAPRF